MRVEPFVLPVAPDNWMNKYWNEEKSDTKNLNKAHEGKKL
jgi:hypothetical protein